VAPVDAQAEEEGAMRGGRSELLRELALLLREFSRAVDAFPLWLADRMAAWIRRQHDPGPLPLDAGRTVVPWCRLCGRAWPCPAFLRAAPPEV
jgi:hypothetical protein